MGCSLYCTSRYFQLRLHKTCAQHVVHKQDTMSVTITGVCRTISRTQTDSNGRQSDERYPNHQPPLSSHTRCFPHNRFTSATGRVQLCQGVGVACPTPMEVEPLEWYR